MRERELTRRIREFFRLGSGDVQTQVGGSAYNPAAVAITGGNTWFVPTGGSSGVAVSAPADTSEDVLGTIAIPALSVNAVIRVTAYWTFTNNANNKTPRIRYSGAGGTIFFSATITTQTTLETVTEIFNRGATNSQEGGTRGQTGAGTNVFNANVTSAVDSSVATSVVLSVQKATGSDTATLEAYLVEVLKP